MTPEVAVKSLRYLALALILSSMVLLGAACASSQSVGQKLAQTCFQSCQTRYQVCTGGAAPITECLDGFRSCQNFCE